MTDIEALLKLCEAATPGPWKRTGHYFIQSRHGDRSHVAFCPPVQPRPRMNSRGAPPDQPEYQPEQQPVADAEFIAAAREAVPELCRELKDAREWLARFAQDSEAYELGRRAGLAEAVAAADGEVGRLAGDAQARSGDARDRTLLAASVARHVADLIRRLQNREGS